MLISPFSFRFQCQPEYITSALVIICRSRREAQSASNAQPAVIRAQMSPGPGRTTFCPTVSFEFDKSKLNLYSFVFNSIQLPRARKHSRKYTNTTYSAFNWKQIEFIKLLTLEDIWLWVLYSGRGMCIALKQIPLSTQSFINLINKSISNQIIIEMKTHLVQFNKQFFLFI